MAINLQHVQEVAKLPESFDGNGFLFATALTALMSIACLSIAVCGWMARDTWRDRYNVHPRQLLFQFRLMIAIIGATAFLRCLPEVLYLQAYGDKDLAKDTIQLILTCKRAADTLALPFVAGWMLILVAIYPSICIALKQGPARAVEVDHFASWPRLARPVVVFLCICVISSLTAYAKVYTN